MTYEEIPIWGVKICQASVISPGVDEDTSTPIETEDWKPDQYHFPSRSARYHLTETDESINFGVIEDLPKQKKKQGPPPPGNRLGHRGNIEQKSMEEGEKRRLPYYSGPEEEIIRVNSKDVVELNMNHKFVIRYFKPGEGFVLYSRVHNLTILLFRALASLALSVVREYRKKKLVDPQKEDVEHEYLNAVTLVQIAQCPLIEDLCKKIDKC